MLLVSLTMLFWQCPAGSYSTSGASYCSLCPVGKFSKNSGATQCSECWKGPCAMGYRPQKCSIGSTEDASCKITDPLLAMSILTPFFVLCSLLSCVKARSAQQEFDDELMKRYMALAGSLLIAFSLGWFGASQLWWPRGAIVPTCNPGTYSVGSDCIECRPGTYSTVTEASECELCPMGFVAPQANATSCVACSPGKFASSRGSSACEDCPKGTYASFWNSSACQLCAAGKSTSFPGGTICEDCKPGTYSAAAGDECKPCQAGYEAKNAGMQACRPCVNGAEVSPTCILCQAGTYSAGEGKANFTIFFSLSAL
jgi:hypothetical protein